MKVLLIGEYSGFHYTLAKGLRGLGHQVVVCSDGDGYKAYPNDISFPQKERSSPKKKAGIVLDWIKEFLGVRGILDYFNNTAFVRDLSGFDVVQIINPIALENFGSIANILFIRRLAAQNKKLYLCALGDDFEWVSACINKKYKYSALTRLSFRTSYRYLYSLRYIYGLFFKQLHKYSVRKCVRIIPGLIDYKIAYQGYEKCTEVIPIPISPESLHAPKKTSYPIKIFHGWQTGRELKKGNDIFADAISELRKRFGTDIFIYEEVRSVPFETYKKLFQDADIILDQCYSYDCGINALLGMAAGKAVFSGFEMRTDQLGINALPSTEFIYSELLSLIENIDEIDYLKKNAYEHIKNKHSDIKVAAQYIQIWTHTH